MKNCACYWFVRGIVNFEIFIWNFKLSFLSKQTPRLWGTVLVGGGGGASDWSEFMDFARLLGDFCGWWNSPNRPVLNLVQAGNNIQCIQSAPSLTLFRLHREMLTNVDITSREMILWKLLSSLQTLVKKSHRRNAYVVAIGYNCHLCFKAYDLKLKIGTQSYFWDN